MAYYCLDLFLSTFIIYMSMSVCVHTLFICFTFTYVGAWQIILPTCTPSGAETHPAVASE